jgi:Protein of unknown function (DUF1640)
VTTITRTTAATAAAVAALQAMLEQDARLGGFKAELIQKQDMHLATLQKDLDRQQNYLDRMRSEVRHEIDKLSASQRLDLNLEKGCACWACCRAWGVPPECMLLCTVDASSTPGCLSASQHWCTCTTMCD